MIKAQLDRALRWWLGELSGLIPAGRTRDEALALWQPDRLTLLRRQGTLASALPIEAARQQPLLLRVVGARLWRKTFPLPRTAQPFMRQIFTQEMDRRTPWRADQVYFHLEADRDPSDSTQLTVSLTLLPKNALNPALDQLAALDLRADRLELCDKADPAAIGPTLALADGRPLLTAAAASLRPAYALLALTLLAALSLAGQGLARVVLEQQLSEARQAARVTRSLSAEIAAIERRQHFPTQRKNAVTPALVSLNALAQALPDDSYAEELTLKDGSLEVTGIAADAARLLALIDATAVLQGAEFRAPVTAAGGAQRFHLAAHIVTPGEPHAVP